MPDRIEIVAVFVTGLLVFRPGVRGLALVGPLLLAVGAGEDGLVARGLVGGAGHGW